MSLFRRKEPSAALLRRACEHPAWEAIRADLEIPRSSSAAVIRSAHEDFVAGFDKQVFDAEVAVAAARGGVRQAIVDFVAFDSTQDGGADATGLRNAPQLITATRRLRVLFKNKGGP